MRAVPNACVLYPMPHASNTQLRRVGHAKLVAAEGRLAPKGGTRHNSFEIGDPGPKTEMIALTHVRLGVSYMDRDGRRTPRTTRVPKNNRGPRRRCGHKLPTDAKRGEQIGKLRWVGPKGQGEASANWGIDLSSLLFSSLLVSSLLSSSPLPFSCPLLSALLRPPHLNLKHVAVNP